MFNNEDLNDLQFQYKDLLEERLKRLKAISQDIIKAEALLNSSFLSEFRKEYSINDKKYIISWEKRSSCSKKRIYIDDTYGSIKPIDETKADFRLLLSDILVDFLQSALKTL